MNTLCVCLKESLQALGQGHACRGWWRWELKGLRGGTEKAREWSSLLRRESDQVTILLLPISEEKPEASPTTDFDFYLSSHSGSLLFLENLRAFVPDDPSARKNPIPDSCTAHSSLHLGLCSNVTIQRALPWLFRKEQPLPHAIIHPSHPVFLSLLIT